jgi:hypothetical protein
MVVLVALTVAADKIIKQVTAALMVAVVVIMDPAPAMVRRVPFA